MALWGTLWHSFHHTTLKLTLLQGTYYMTGVDGGHVERGALLVNSRLEVQGMKEG